MISIGNCLSSSSRKGITPVISRQTLNGRALIDKHGLGAIKH